MTEEQRLTLMNTYRGLNQLPHFKLLNTVMWLLVTGLVETHEFAMGRLTNDN